MKRCLLTNALMVALFFLAGSAWGEVIILDSLDTGVTVTASEPTDSTITLHFTIGSFGRDSVSTDSGICYRVRCLDEGFLMHDTTDEKPELPIISRSIIIPECDSISINVDSTEYSTFADYPVLPSRGQNSIAHTEPFVFGDVYSDSAWYPGNLVYNRDPFVLRDYQGVNIVLNAFQSKPALDSLRVYTSVYVTITCHNPQEINVGNIVYEFDRIYNRRFVNYSLHRTQSTGDMVPGDLLVITTDSMYNSTTDLVNWKRQKGIYTTVLRIDEIGNDSSSIIDTIRAYYNQSDLAYVLIFGDRDSIYVPYCSVGQNTWYVSNTHADPLYSLIDGDDNYPDVFTGRLSICDASVGMIACDRICNYEKNTFSSDWYNKAICIAELDSSAPPMVAPHMDTIKTLLYDYGYSHVDTFFVPESEDHTSALSDDINDGRGLILYMGHGGYGRSYSIGWYATGFNTDDVFGLANANELPFVFSSACENGAIVQCNEQLFGSGWIMASDNGEPTGGIGTYMSSGPSRWISYYAIDDFVKSVGIGDLSTIGGLCYNASIDMMTKMPLATDIFKTYIIHGDPSLQLRIKNPDSMIVSAPDTVYHNAASVSITVQNLEGALCALSQDGELCGSAYTNEYGNSTVNITYKDCISELSPLILTVTAYNKVTYIDSITVILSSYMCGDANGDASVNMLDVNFMASYLYSQGDAPCPCIAANVNGMNGINMLDVTYLLNYLYNNGPAPNCAECSY